jgi:hypothetical protein
LLPVLVLVLVLVLVMVLVLVPLTFHPDACISCATREPT